MNIIYARVMGISRKGDSQDADGIRCVHIVPDGKEFLFHPFVFYSEDFSLDDEVQVEISRMPKP